MNNILGEQWILFVSRRFSRVDRKGRSAVTSFLASLGICFGIMTLIVVMSVMNGFQMEFKDAIMELSSYHVQVTGVDDATVEMQFTAWCNAEHDILAASPFYEAQSFMVTDRGKQSAALIRAVPENICDVDSGFAREMHMLAGSFSLHDDDAIVLGSDLARALSVRTGDVVTLLALSGGSDVELLSRDRQFRVAGVFRCGYADINASYAFINFASGQKNFWGKRKKSIRA